MAIMTRGAAWTASLGVAVSAVIAATGCATTSNGGAADGAASTSTCVEAGGLCGVSACSAVGPQSCGSKGETCCLDSLGPLCAAEAGATPIVASSYDQSCQVDSDCVAIGVGDSCYPCGVVCPGNAAINASSLARYMQDVAASPAGKGGFFCNCPLYSPSSVCCNAGLCAPYCLDLVDAGADAAPSTVVDGGADGSSVGDGGADAAPVVDASTDDAAVDAGRDAAPAFDAGPSDAGAGD
jgi:hypothetical protein